MPGCIALKGEPRYTWPDAQRLAAHACARYDFFEEDLPHANTAPSQTRFEAIEAAAIESADRRTMILALIGNLVFSWSNNESMFIYILMILLETDEVSAAIVFATLNTTRARLDLVQRLATAKINDQQTAKMLDKIITRFNESTRVRNEFNHCMYTVNERGEITHTHAMKIKESRGHLTLGDLRPMDDARIAELVKSVGDLKSSTATLWEFLPRAAVGCRSADDRNRGASAALGVTDRQGTQDDHRSNLRPRFSGFAISVGCPSREHVQTLDKSREGHCGVDVALWNVGTETFGDQRHADHEKEAERQHDHCRIGLDEFRKRFGSESITVTATTTAMTMIGT